MLPVRLKVPPAQTGEAVLIAAVVIVPAVGVPLQAAGAASKPKRAVAASAPEEEALVLLPYILPFLPVTLYWLTVMPVALEPPCVTSSIRFPPE